MATYDLAFAERLDGVVVLQTFVPNGIGVSDSVVIAGAPHGMSGTHKIISTEEFAFIGLDDQGDLLFDYDVIRLNQIIYVQAGDNEPRDTATGTVTLTETCTWITNQMVLDWLGVAPATANDTAFVTVCTEAGNALAYRRRKSAGYTDSLTTVPSSDVKLGTIMYAAGLYRARGSASYEGFASYESMSVTQPNVAMGEILRLWGCNRPQVA